MKKTLKVLSIIVAVLLVLIFSLVLAVTEVKRPASNRYLQGHIKGPLSDLFNSSYSFVTYNLEGNILRSDEVDIFLMRRFFIEFVPGEEVVRVYISSYHQKNIATGTLTGAELIPEILVIEELESPRVRFVQKTMNLK